MVLQALISKMKEEEEERRRSYYITRVLRPSRGRQLR
jgi:hypothetical protein